MQPLPGDSAHRCRHSLREHDCPYGVEGTFCKHRFALGLTGLAEERQLARGLELLAESARRDLDEVCGLGWWQVPSTPDLLFHAVSRCVVG